MEGSPVLEVVDSPLDAEDAIRASQPLPEALPVLPLRESVAFPETLNPLAVGQERSIELVDDVLGGNRMLVMVASRDPENETPGPGDLYDVGVVGFVSRMVKIPDGTLRILVQGTQRVTVGEYLTEQPYLVARISELADVAEPSAELAALTRNVQQTFSEIVELIPYLPEELQLAVANIDDPAALGYLIAGSLRISTEEKQKLLEEVDVAKRLRHLSRVLAGELEVVQLGTQIQSQVQSEVDKGQREFLLRQQLKAIQEELGEGDEQQAEVTELRQRIEAAELPADALKAAERELARLEKLPPAAAEHGVIRTYLEWLTELPWSVETEDNLDIKHARKVLDADHYDLEEVKDRILEYLAVRKLKGDMKGPILCFVGPPGVGKTSLGQSVARAMNRQFVRISLGGVRDEAEIRGHRRTYIGSMPGRIAQALRQAGSANPVFMLDEIEKMSAGFQGDPSAALLEVLDPAQNNSFRDHYLELPYDLSHVLFITTANQLGPVHPALLDRMEVINLAGYTEEEKVHISRRYLLPRQLNEHGLPPTALELTDRALRKVIMEYTREAGVRNLERQLGTLARKVAARIAGVAPPPKPGTRPTSDASIGAPVSAKAAVPDAPTAADTTEKPVLPVAKTAPASLPEVTTTVIDVDALHDYLGRPRFRQESAFRTSRPGVATGVAWTETGGEVLFIEASLLPAGHGQIQLTGQLGSVMQESARAAVSHIRSQAEALGVPPNFLEKHDLHVHIPAGAIPKDGPSAGVTMATAILSALRREPVNEDVAMTGEITLSGLVLPVGGIREKALAARRHGIRTFVLPAENEGDLEDLPADLRNEMAFVPVSTLDEVLKVALPAAVKPEAPVS